MFKKILSMLLCLMTICSIIPMVAMTSSAAAEPITGDISIKRLDITTKAITEPTITSPGTAFYNGVYISINGTRYYSGDQFPEGHFKVGDKVSVTVEFASMSGYYFAETATGSGVYAGKVSVNGGYVNSNYVSNSATILKIKFMMSVKSPDITSDITVDGVDYPVHGAEARSSEITSKTTMSHPGLKVKSAYFGFQKPGNTTWYVYPNNTLDSSFSYNKFAYCVEYEVDPAYNITGFVNKITWNGQKVSSYANLKSGKGYCLYFYCDITSVIRNSVVIKDIDPPVHGATPDRTGTAPHGLEITKIQYVKASDRSGEFEGTFDATKHVGKDYIELGVEVRALPGYTFEAAELSVFCNGQVANGYVNRGDGKYVYIFKLEIANKQLTEVDIFDIDIPVHGATPDRTGTAPEGIEITKIQYVKASDRSGEFNGVFDATKHVGKDYIELGVEIKAKTGFTFDPTTVRVYCNGDVHDGYINRDDGKYVYLFKLTVAKKQITKVDIFDIDIPVHGATPDRTGTASEGVEITNIQYVQASDHSKEFEGIFDATKHVGSNRIDLAVELKAKPGYSLDNAAVWCNGELYETRIMRDDDKLAYLFPLVVAEGFTNPFTDVKETDWYYDSVLWAVQNGITNGTTATTFSPTMVCDRSQAVQFLWNAAGNPEPTSTANPFTDVKESDWYYKAVMWAVENGITNGTSATTFSPTMKCSRSQIVTFLWKAQGKPVLEATNPFTDVKTKDWFYDSVMWAVANGITAGTSATTFAPDMNCDRSQIVTFIYRSYADA